MSSFFKKIGLFFLLCLSISLVIIAGYMFTYKISVDDIPSPPISDSYSLNEKIEFLRTVRKDVPVLAIGSSIALNNLHSESVAEYLNPNTFLNTSSWGMDMEDNFLLLKVLHDVYTLDTLILVSNIVEFEKMDKQVDYSLLKKYLSSNNFVANWYHLKCFNLRYYMNNTKYKKHVRSDKHHYEYLVFDQYGGVNIDDTYFKIDQQRWVSSFDSKNIDPVNYSYLDSISTFCKNKNIKFLFFNSPFREGLWNTLDRERASVLKSHMNHVEAILNRDQNIIIDANKILWKDSLFIDGVHLSNKGAKMFTGYCFDQLDSLYGSPTR